MKSDGMMWAAALAAFLAAPAGAWAQPVNPGGGPAQPPNANAAPQAQAVPQGDVSGEAFGMEVTKPVGQGLGKTAKAALSPGGPRLEEGRQGPFSTPPGQTRLSAKLMGSTVSGAVGKNAATSQGKSSVAGVDILGGVIKADQVLAVASSVSNGGKASSNAAGSQILGLVINGVAMGDLTPAPNTIIGLPGVGDVILNEQVPAGDGVTATGLQVNMIHVVQKDPLTGGKAADIIVGSAASGARFKR